MKSSKKIKAKETPVLIANTSFNHLSKMMSLLCAAVGLILYINTINHDYTIDDDTVIAKNTIVTQGIAGIDEIFTTSYRKGFWDRHEALYRPLSLVMFAVEWQVAPEQPWFSHLVNILIYSLTGFVLFITLRLMLHKYNLLIPFFSTLLFLVHPIHTEVVSNIKSRDELLSFLFLMVSLLFLFKSITAIKKGKLYIALSLISFLLALLSKESAITFIFVFPLCLFFFSELKMKSILFKVALFTLPLILYLGLRYNAIHEITNSLEILPINNSLITAPDVAGRIATAIKIMGKYMGLLVFPHPLSFDYSFNTISNSDFSDPLVIFTLLLYSVLIYYALRTFRNKNIFSFCILFFLITMSLVSNLFFMIESTMAERFLYISSLGFCIGLSVLILKLNRGAVNIIKEVRFSGLMRSYKTSFAILFLILCLFSIKTFSRSADWKDNLTLLKIDMKTCPNSCRMRFAYGSTLLMKYALKEKNPTKKVFMIDDAILNLEKGISILPTYAEAYFHLGLAYSEKKDYVNASRYFEEANSKKSWEDPEFSVSAGLAYHMNGQCDKAEQQFEKAATLKPGLKEVYSNWGLCLTERGKINDAIVKLDIATNIDSSFGSAWYNKGNAYARGSMFQSAITCYTKSLQLDSNNIDALVNIGNCYGAMKDTENAIITFEKVLIKDPQNIKAITNLAITYRIIGDEKRATDYFSLLKK